MKMKYVIESGMQYEDRYSILVVDSKEQAEQKVKEFEDNIPVFCSEYADEVDKAEEIAEHEALKVGELYSKEYCEEYDKVIEVLMDDLEVKYPGKAYCHFDTVVYYMYSECAYEPEDRGDSDDVLDAIERKFTSGNSVPVQSAMITAEEWNYIKRLLRPDE